MTENQFQAKLLRALRAYPLLKDAVIFKHADRFSGGIPDISITSGGKTTWLELKVAPNRCTKLQLYYIERLGAWIVTLCKDGTVFFGHSKGHRGFMPFDEAVTFIARNCVSV